jgi:hypothetical protein
MARVSQVRSNHSVCCLHTGRIVGGIDVPLSTRRTNLHHAMVFARRIPLVPMVVRCGAVDAFRGAGAGRFAIRRRLVVRK